MRLLLRAGHGAFLLLLLIGVAPIGAAMPIQEPGGPGGGGPGNGPPGLQLGGPPGLDPGVVIRTPGGPPDLPPPGPEGGLPVQIERLDRAFVLEIFHPRAEELNFRDPFLSIRVTPGLGPDTVEFLARPGRSAVIPEPSTLLLVSSAGLIALAARRRLSR